MNGHGYLALLLLLLPASAAAQFTIGGPEDEPPKLKVEAGGLAATARNSALQFSSHRARQWEHPNGWAPHQVLAWAGLARFGFHTERQRLAYKWLYMITRNAADYAGTVPEKFDVVRRTHRVYAEYGNVGTEFRYITDEGFGWMNASYQVGLGVIGGEGLERLKRLAPPR